MRYQRRPRREPGSSYAARFTAPGRSLDDLYEVARVKDPAAALGEQADLGVLVVRYLDVPDDHPARLRYEVVPEGSYLVYSDEYHLLYSDDARSFESEHVAPEETSPHPAADPMRPRGMS